MAQESVTAVAASDRLATIRAATERFIADFADPARGVPPSQAARATQLAQTANRNNEQVAWVRDRLVQIRSDQQSAVAAKTLDARVARVCLIALAPAVVSLRGVLTPSWLAEAVRTPAGVVGLLFAIALATVGSFWTWRVTSPRIGLDRRTPAGQLTHLLRLRQACEQLAVRLAAGTEVRRAARRVEMLNHLRLGSLSSVTSTHQAMDLVEACTQELLVRSHTQEGHIALVTFPPFLVCLLPAVALIVLL